MFGGDSCTRLPWNINTEPGLPVGETIPPSEASWVGDDPQLKQFAENTLPVLQQHLQMAQNLPEATAQHGTLKEFFICWNQIYGDSRNIEIG